MSGQWLPQHDWPAAPFILHPLESCVMTPSWEGASCLRLRNLGRLENKEQSPLRASWDTWLQCMSGDGYQKLTERERLWPVVSWEVKGSWWRELVAPSNCLWKISKTKHLTFAGTELRFLKLFAGRWVLRLSNAGDLIKHSPESSGTHSHSVCVAVCHQRWM
jgi:hypothetical protein